MNAMNWASLTSSSETAAAASMEVRHEEEGVQAVPRLLLLQTKQCTDRLKRNGCYLERFTGWPWWSFTWVRLSLIWMFQHLAQLPSQPIMPSSPLPGRNSLTVKCHPNLGTQPPESPCICNNANASQMLNDIRFTDACMTCLRKSVKKRADVILLVRDAHEAVGWRNFRNKSCGFVNLFSNLFLPIELIVTFRGCKWSQHDGDLKTTQQVFRSIYGHSWRTSVLNTWN